MSRLTTVTAEILAANTQTALDPFRVNNQIADVYLQIANSESTLRAYLSMETALKTSALSDAEIEAIKLLVSEINQCEYCLSVHHIKAGKAGFSEAQRVAIRKGHAIGNERVDVLIETVLAFFKQPGPLADFQLERLRKAGFDDQQLVELTLAIATIFFTNMFNHINNTQPTLPSAPAIAQQD